MPKTAVILYRMRAVSLKDLSWDLARAKAIPELPKGRRARHLDELVSEIARSSSAIGQSVELNWRDILAMRLPKPGSSQAGICHKPSQVSFNGSCRLIRAYDGWVALNLPRPSDICSIEALTERNGCYAGTDGSDPRSHIKDPWCRLVPWISRKGAREVVDRARLLGLAAAVLNEAVANPLYHPKSTLMWSPLEPRPLEEISAVDLSAMWAGPLAALVLYKSGATVTKVETTTRPDGARSIPEFYYQLHPPNQPGLTVDLASSGDLADLRHILEEADVIIEASRPRALKQLSLDPRSLRSRPGRVWLSITGYGRCEPGGNWIAFGDDAAVAGGLVSFAQEGAPVFCGDAIADPITGLFGAAAVMQSLLGGGGHLIDLSMAGCAASISGASTLPSALIADRLPRRSPPAIMP